MTTFFAVVVAVLAVVGSASADYMPFNGSEVAPNIAEIRVGNDGVRIGLEIFVADAKWFEDLIPDSWFKEGATARANQDERLDKFAETGLTVRRKDGTALPVSLETIETRMRVDRTNALSGQRDPVTGRTFPKPPDDPRVLYVELFYDFQGDRPDVIEFAPPSDTGGLPLATIGMMVFDREVPVINFRYLSGPARLTLNWSDPWYSRFDNPNLTRHHKSGTTTYLYVEPREVRHETLIRVRDLDPWLGLGLETGEVLDSEVQDVIKAQAVEFLTGRNPLRIDGKAVQSEAQQVEILRINTKALEIVGSGTSVSGDAAFVGVILSFPVVEIPDRVQVTWDMFDEQTVKISATAIDPAGPFLTGASADDPEFDWKNHLRSYKNPHIAAVPTGGMGKLRIPILTVALALAALCAAVLAIRGKGLGRKVAAVAVVAGLAGSALTTQVAVFDAPHPFAQPPDAATAGSVFAALLDNVNIANLEVTAQARAREMGHVATKASVSEVVAELDRALAIRIPSGGLARVTSISDPALTELGPVRGGYGFQALAEWEAEASAGHWGHNHRRLVRYRALVEVVEQEGNWKLDGITVIEARAPDA
ncbi:MAG: hypothetical protein ABJH85_18715 [Paracoccaceae bacterium]